MSYIIQRTDKANDQLMEIIRYIVADIGSTDVALSYLDKIEHTVINLANQPNMGSYPRYSILKRQGYRVLIVGTHLFFYKVDEAAKIVTIHAIVDGRQEYLNLI